MDRHRWPDDLLIREGGVPFMSTTSDAMEPVMGTTCGMAKRRKYHRIGGTVTGGYSSGGDGTMQIKTIINDTGRTLRIWVSDCLDLQLHGVFTKAALVASYILINDIEIDLQNTREIRDSGLALLLMLARKSGLQHGSIKLVNCPRELRSRLLQNNLNGHFQVC
jgi:ABC-type transporter Mla MlaB component